MIRYALTNIVSVEGACVKYFNEQWHDRLTMATMPPGFPPEAAEICDALDRMDAKTGQVRGFVPERLREAVPPGEPPASH